MQNLEIREIADIEDISYVETTTGTNGYPKNINQALTDFKSWDYCQYIARKYNLEIVKLHSRDGWHFWENKGWTNELIKTSADDYGDNYKLIEFKQFSEQEFIQEFIPDIEDLRDMADFMDRVKYVLDSFEEYNKLKQGQAIVLHENYYYDTIDVKSLSFSEDSHNWQIALVKK